MSYLFINSTIVNIKTELLKDLEHYRKKTPYLFVDYNEGTLLNLFNDLIMSSIALSFLCFYYKAKIEYFMSVAKVEEKDSKKLFRNIGGLIIAYKSDYEIEMKDRIVLNLVSDRITSVVAGNYLNSQIEEKDASEVLESWGKTHYAQKRKTAYKTEKLNKENYLSFNQNISNQATTLWQAYINDNNTQAKSINTKLNISDKATFSSFLICRRIILAFWKNRTTENTEYQSNAYKYLSGNSTGGQLNKFMSDFCFKTSKGDLLFLPEELEWYSTLEDNF